MAFWHNTERKSSRAHRDQELQREIQDHLQLETEEQGAAGADSTEARYRAVRLFGNTARTTEDVRHVWGLLWLEQLGQDLRLGLRRLWKNPGFAVVAVLTFALGVGANTAIFSLVYSVAFKPLPVSHPEQLYSLGDNVNQGQLTGIQQDFSVFSYPLYREVRDHTPEFSAIAAFGTSTFNVTVRRDASGDLSHAYAAEFISGNYFEAMGLTAFAGRTLTAEDDRQDAAPVVVMSYRAFVQQFAADRSILGHTLFVNGSSMTLVGIAPPGFFGETLETNPPDFWLPLALEPLLHAGASHLEHPDTYWLYAIGRLSSGANLAQAQAHVTAEIQRWYVQDGEVPPAQRSDIDKVKVTLTSAANGIVSLKRNYGDGLRLMLIFSGLVLLISCANVSNLLLARSVADSPQTALRVAIGASRWRLVRQALTEGTVIALLGGIAGVLLAFYGTHLLLALAFRGAGYVPIDAAPSAAVLAVTFALSLANGILFSAAPAWLASRTQPVEALGSGGRSIGDASGLARKGFVVLQAALSVILLVGAGLLTSSLDRLRFQQFGFDPDNRYVVDVDPGLAGYPPAQLQGLYRNLESSLSEIPGIRGVSYSFIGPMSGGAWINAIRIKEHANGPTEPKDATEGAAQNNVSSNYFQTMGMHLLRGRLFGDQDSAASHPVAVVSEAFVKKFFAPGEDPLGKHLDRGELTFGGDYEIVGVVEDAKYANPSESAQPVMFVPLLQMAAYSNQSDLMFQTQENYIRSIQLRTSTHIQNLELQVRKVLAGINQNFTILDFKTMDEQVERRVNSSRLLARITMLYSLLSLLLASVALYGVAAYAVARRTNEIGVRMALGANRTKVFSMILRSSLLPVAFGLLCGIAVVLAAGRVLATLLYGIRPTDPRVIAGSALVLVGCALIAALVPAIRASSVSPARALRRE